VVEKSSMAVLFVELLHVYAEDKFNDAFIA
jgi:hypothetical protein